MKHPAARLLRIQLRGVTASPMQDRKNEQDGGSLAVCSDVLMKPRLPWSCTRIKTYLTSCHFPPSFPLHLLPFHCPLCILSVFPLSLPFHCPLSISSSTLTLFSSFASSLKSLPLTLLSSILRSILSRISLSLPPSLAPPHRYLLHLSLLQRLFAHSSVTWDAEKS